MGSVVTVGTFDGVHQGHREVLSVLKLEASKLHLKPVVVTFDRHPLETIDPERTPKLIMNPDARDRLLQNEGVEVIRIPFTPDLRSMTVRKWMQTLKERYGAEAIVLGYDNKFGSDGRGMPFDEYKRIGEETGLKIILADAVDGCSSTAVRREVSKGDIAKANEILGRPFAIAGKVCKGRQLGRTIGFPTANVEVSDRQLLPLPGVYAAEVEADGKSYKALVNIGNNPTVSVSAPLSVEAHLMDYSGNLYGKTIKINFLRRIRDEKKFSGLSELRHQIQKDILALHPLFRKDRI